MNGKVAAVAERVPARVIGDGTHTVREHIASENRDPRRGVGHTKTLTCLPVFAVPGFKADDAERRLH